MFNTSLLEINKSAVENNIKFLKKQFGGSIKISSVVKGNAYGHGIEAFIPIVEDCGIRHFSVFSAVEALKVKKVIRKNSDIMIMGMIDNSELEWAITNKIELFVFDLERLNYALSVSQKLNKPARIHLEVETGMNRTGFKKEYLKEVAKIITSNYENFIVEGLCTHYAGAESIANYVRIQKQIKLFNSIYKWFVKNGITPKRQHTACSAAAMTYPQTRMDMVRIGILQYGYWPSKETFIHYVANKENKSDPLKRVITWKTKIMSIKEVDTGEFVGYGTTYLALTKMKVAIIPVGYSHGYSRSLSNQGRLLIRGHRVSVIGLVNMNLLTADVTQIPGVKIDDEVILIGTQGDLSISVSSFSELSDQVNYELLTRLPSQIPRVIV